MPNRLAGETSPYLRQHAENPVDWYPWGPEALERARTEHRPILVSIGYSACHWCHVMAHESFEDDRTARLMNERFVNIKVDREERPDVDSIYMEAVQGLTGSGGWPLNVFLTPDTRPFFGGTYFPPEPRHGLPSWIQVLEGVAETFAARPDDVEHNAATLTAFIAQSQHQGDSDETLDHRVVSEAYAVAEQQFDRRHGGFGTAPKFPQPLGLEFILGRWSETGDARALEFVETTLDRMAAGGIYDQVGGGFHRYSVDGVWLVPHFEKMLYDNALLARTYTSAHLATGHVRYRRIAEETLDYVLRELRAPEGGFYSSQDADTEGVEGRYYVWTSDELVSVLGHDDAEIASIFFGVTPAGNFEGKSILTRALTTDELSIRTGVSEAELAARLDGIRTALLSARGNRVHPATDTKILTSWNALAIRSLAESGRIFDRPDYLQAAEQAMRFLLSALRPDGRLVRSYLQVPGQVGAFLEDYAFTVEGLIGLYMTVFDPEYLDHAQAMADAMIERFVDSSGAFFDTGSDADDLVVRPRSVFDNPIPSGNSAAAFALARLAALTGRSDYGDRARSCFRAARKLFVRAPLGVSYALSALDFYLSNPMQIAIAAQPDEPDALDLVRAVYRRYVPHAVIAVGPPNSMPLLAARELLGGRATAYVCRNFSCRLPVTSRVELEAQLDSVQA